MKNQYKKIVIDTSVLMNDEEALYKFGDNELIIPSIVWEELNDKKDYPDPAKNYLPRQVLRLLNDLADVRPLREGVRLKEISETSKAFL